MDEHQELRTTAQVVAANMRSLRESRAKVLHDVATAARELGLSWDASAVSRIETGRRELTLEEFLALPLVMTVALNEPVTLVQLLDVGADLSSGRDEITAAVSHDRFSLSSFDRRTWILPILEMLAEPFMVFAQLETRFGDDGKTITDLVKAGLNQEKREIYVARAPEEDRRSFENLRQLAKDLGVRPGDVMDAAKALWGKHVLLPEDEAERRLLDSDIDLSNPNSVRTMRGHITRQVMRELADHFAAKRLEDGEATSARDSIRPARRTEGSAMAKGDIETYYEDGQWKNKSQGNQRASSTHDTKAEAQAAGRDVAVARGVEHVIKKKDGTIGEKNTYPRERDPRRSKG